MKKILWRIRTYEYPLRAYHGSNPHFLLPLFYPSFSLLTPSKFFLGVDTPSARHGWGSTLFFSLTPSCIPATSEGSLKPDIVRENRHWSLNARAIEFLISGFHINFRNFSLKVRFMGWVTWRSSTMAVWLLNHSLYPVTLQKIKKVLGATPTVT